MKKSPFTILVLGLLLSLLVAGWVYAAIIILPPQKMELLARLGGEPGQPLAYVTDVAVAGHWAYALDADQGLVALDVRDPRHPVIRSQLSLPAWSGGLAVQGDRAYVIKGRMLYIIDVSNPEAPALQNTVEFPPTTYFHDIRALPDRVYLLDDDHLYAVDSEGEESPVLLAAPGGGYVFVWDQEGRRYAFLTNHTHGTGSRTYRHIILDITDEASPQLLSEITTPGKGGDVVVQKGVAYLGAGYAYDVRDLTHPALATLFDGHEDNRLSLEGVHLVIKSPSETTPFHMLDISDPNFFPVIAAADLPSEYLTGRGDLKDGLLYVAGDNKGLLIYRYLPRTVAARWREAEDGEVAAPMVVRNENQACGGGYVLSPQAWSEGALTLQFDVSEPDNYFIWVRARGMGWSENSFWVSIDGGAAFHYEIRPPDGAWHWARIYPEHEEMRPFGLNAGPHVIRFSAREANSSLDAIYITNHPDLHPDDASPCVSPATPTPTSSPTATPVRVTPTPTSTPSYPPLPTPRPFGLEAVGRFGGHPFGGSHRVAAAWGSLVALAHANRVTLADVSDPYRFVMLGESGLPRYIGSLGSKDHTVFAMDSYGMTVVDFSDPIHPQQIAYFPDMIHLPGTTDGIYMADSRLYLVNQDLWTVYDIAQPQSPHRIGQMTIPFDYDAVAFAGDWAYVMEARRLLILDLHDPSTPMLAGSYLAYPQVTLHELLARPPMVYLLAQWPAADGDELGVLILDVSDAAHPVTRGRYVAGKVGVMALGGLAIHGHSLYLGVDHAPQDGWERRTFIVELDISDPEHPRQVRNADTEDFFQPFFATETRLYAKSYDLRVFQLPDLKGLPLNPATGDYDGIPIANGISGQGADVYLWDGYAVRVIDNATPSAPVEREKLSYPNPLSVYLAGSRLYRRYLTGSGYGQTICITDITAPDAGSCAHPAPMSDPDFFDREVSGAWIIAESQEYALIGYWKWRDIAHTDIIDVHDLDAMQVLHVLPYMPADARVLNVDGEPYAVLGLNSENAPPFILIKSLHPPYDTIGRFDLGGPSLADMKLDIANQLLLVLTRDWIPRYDLRLIDLSDPAHPREVGSYRFENAEQGEVHSLEATHGRAYAAIGRQLRVVDISHPSHPVERGVYLASGAVVGTHARPPLVSLALGDAGMMNLVELTPAPPRIYMPLVRH